MMLPTLVTVTALSMEDNGGTLVLSTSSGQRHRLSLPRTGQLLDTGHISSGSEMPYPDGHYKMCLNDSLVRLMIEGMRIGNWRPQDDIGVNVLGMLGWTLYEYGGDILGLNYDNDSETVGYNDEMYRPLERFKNTRWIGMDEPVLRRCVDGRRCERRVDLWGWR